MNANARTDSSKNMNTKDTADKENSETTLNDTAPAEVLKPHRNGGGPAKGIKSVREEEDKNPIPEKEAPAKAKSEESSFSFAPKTFLQPYMLLLLKQWSMHGYEVWERLMRMGFPGFDQNDRATVYRALRQLEKEGKVKSEWDTNAEGPARRIYTLTDAGEEFLNVWANGLDQYRKTLDFFFKLYTGGMVPSPFSFTPTIGENNDKNTK